MRKFYSIMSVMRQSNWVQYLLNCLLVLIAGTGAHGAEKFPVNRPLIDLNESALQLVSREGPRYPTGTFLSDVHTCRSPKREADSADGGSAAPTSGGCMEGYAVLTMANDVAMQQLVPLLLESLNRIGEPDLSTLAKHTTVVAVTYPAFNLCRQLVRRYRHTCTEDDSSGLYDGDNRFPDFKALAFGMAKLKYIVNALTTNTAILYVDADVVFLRNPFPDLLASGADIAVATAPAPCGSSGAAAGSAGGPSPDPAGRNFTRTLHQAAATDQNGPGAGAGGGASVELFSTGITFYRSSPGALRCAYSVLLDLAQMARSNPGGVALEQERFAAFVPVCTEALGLGFRVLRPPQYVTSCGPSLSEQMRREAVVVHAATPPGSSLAERAPLMQRLLDLALGFGDEQGSAVDAGAGVGAEAAGAAADGLA